MCCGQGMGAFEKTALAHGPLREQLPSWFKRGAWLRCGACSSLSNLEDTYLSIAPGPLAPGGCVTPCSGLSQPPRQQLGERHLLEVCDRSLFSPQTNNELEAQRVATEFALRKRIRDLDRAYDELKWQEQNVNVTSLVIEHSLGWESNPKGSLLCGKLLGLSMVST